MKTGIGKALLLALLICSPLQTPAQNSESVATTIEPQKLSTQASYRGQVKEVTGGDSLTVTLDNKKVSIRLLGVSAIKKVQEFSKASRENLARLLGHQTIEVLMAEPLSTGKPDSPIAGKVLLNGRDVGLEQISAGLAVVAHDDVKYQTDEDRQLYEKAVSIAQEEKRGMWADKYKCKGDPSFLLQPAPPVPKTSDMGKINLLGVVNVQVTIDESGKVISAKALCGHPLLREASVDAALHARFSRTLLSGIPVKVTGIITYNFVAK